QIERIDGQVLTQIDLGNELLVADAETVRDQGAEVGFDELVQPPPSEVGGKRPRVFDRHAEVPRRGGTPAPMKGDRVTGKHHAGDRHATGLREGLLGGPSPGGRWHGERDGMAAAFAVNRWD